MKKRTKIILIAVASFFVLIISFSVLKRVSPLSMGHKEINKPLFSDEAINGYDPVAYFTENKAVEGNKEYTFQWQDATWYFSSEANKNAFSQNPEKYAPQYGGYCSFAVSKGFTANTDPNAFTIYDGKLYLFDSEGVKNDWLSNPSENLKQCDTNWK